MGHVFSQYCEINMIYEDGQAAPTDHPFLMRFPCLSHLLKGPSARLVGGGKPGNNDTNDGHHIKLPQHPEKGHREPRRIRNRINIAKANTRQRDKAEVGQFVVHRRNIACADVVKRLRVPDFNPYIRKQRHHTHQ